MALYLEVTLGAVGLAMFALVLLVFQYLLRELLTSRQRGDELRRLATTDDLTGLAHRLAPGAALVS